jgi:hypothetical protein
MTSTAAGPSDRTRAETPTSPGCGAVTQNRDLLATDPVEASDTWPVLAAMRLVR